MTILDKLLQPVWEISSDPIVITSNEAEPDDRRIVHVNGAFTQLNGYSREESIGRPASLLYGPQTDLNEVRVREGQLRNGRSQEYTLQYYRKDGSAYRCTVTRAPLVDPEGRSDYLIELHRAGSEATAAADGGLPPGTVPLTLPMPLHELSSARQPQHLPSHPELDALEALWLQLSGDRALPRRQDFQLDIMKRWATHLSVAVATPEGRFQFRLFGTALAEVYGRDLTGSFLDGLTPKDLWSVILQHYREVVRTRQPLFAPISVTNGRWYTEVSRLLLPLSGNGEVNFIMGADYRREHL